MKVYITAEDVTRLSRAIRISIEDTDPDYWEEAIQDTVEEFLDDLGEVEET